MITQIVTLAGVLIGALTSYLSTAVAERARHRRGMATRWDERKLNTYIEYASCVKEVYGAAKRARRATEGTEDRMQLLAEMAEAEQRRSILFETLVLLTAPAAIKAAHAVNLCLWQEQTAAKNQDATPVAEGDLEALMNIYHEQARTDLGIPLSPWRD
ncbi:hypothetical protein [Streptomyces griseocarneus]|uniref:hypothetical protein n=1 Tax=Streptomyces griseocarneus TaxID=51201 RepID=UPI00167ED79B|nr:hypothetical protein [Streptomyces griseocarneus]MBZ6478088.1 hypothetical protein [Streptomyces griseocarneus]GHG83801.1 hypothetical protein GCM10018779_67150 [Streptomyces griseocarneus]